MAVVDQQGTDPSLGQERKGKRVQDREDTEDGERDADVGYYVASIRHAGY